MRTFLNIKQAISHTTALYLQQTQWGLITGNVPVENENEKVNYSQVNVHRYPDLVIPLHSPTPIINIQVVWYLALLDVDFRFKKNICPVGYWHGNADSNYRRDTVYEYRRVHMIYHENRNGIQQSDKQCLLSSIPYSYDISRHSSWIVGFFAECWSWAISEHPFLIN